MPRIPHDLAEFLVGGRSILVGTVDDRARPECTRGAGVRVLDGGDRLTLYVPLAGADRTLANLRANGRIAITFSRPHDNRAYQVKGRLRALREPDAEDVQQQERWLAAFVEQLAIVGVSREASRRWRLHPSVAVEVDVEDVFEQTPGPGAGHRVERA